MFWFIHLSQFFLLQNINTEKLIIVVSNIFFFTRLQYESGDWDVDQRMPSNILNSLVEYTTLKVDTQEKIIPLSSDEIFKCPFCYLSGHKLVQFTKKERENLGQKGFDYVYQNYREEVVYSKWLDIIDKAQNGKQIQ